jgi:hypothetical protein
LGMTVKKFLEDYTDIWEYYETSGSYVKYIVRKRRKD